MTVDNIPQGEPREIAARGVHKVVTEKIISQGESPRLPRSVALNAANAARVIDSGSYKGIVFAPTRLFIFGSGLTHGAFCGTG